MKRDDGALPSVASSGGQISPTVSNHLQVGK